MGRPSYLGRQLEGSISCRPTRTLATRVQELVTASSEITHELDDTTLKLFEIFPKQPPSEDLHIIVMIPSGVCRSRTISVFQRN
jgi:hypothetical protein